MRGRGKFRIECMVSLRRWYMFTGCGTALVTPFRRDLSLDEADAAQAGPAADRRRHQFSGALRHHRRKPHADARGAPARGRDHARRSQGQSPGAGRRGRLQHPRSDRTGARTASAWARTASSPSRRTTTSPRRKASTSTTRPSPRAIRLPIIVYSVQGRTGVNVEPATLARLAEIENIVGVKEASGNIGQMANVLHECPRDFTVLSGDDAITLPLIALGGRGIISVVSNEIPGRDDAARAGLPARRFRSGARRFSASTCR